MRKHKIFAGAVVVALTFAAGATTSAQQPDTGGLAYVDPATVETLDVPLGALVGSQVRVRGTLASGRPGDTVAVQRLDQRDGWVTAATTTLDRARGFVAAFRATKAGRTTIRAVLTAAAPQTAVAAASVGRTLTVYRRVTATWYGPGLYGRRTACGQKLTTRLLGVAHRTLPCGTRVDIYKNGRTISVPVVDRGPFRRDASYDLTAATAKALGVRATTTVGVLHTPSQPASQAKRR